MSLYVLNKSGGLIYQKDLLSTANQSTNNHVRMGGLFYGMYAITKEVSPIEPSDGIKTISCEGFKLYCFQTATGTTFFLSNDQPLAQADGVLGDIYRAYSDYVLKDPFYELEQPIRCPKFDLHLEAIMNKHRD